MIKTSLRNGELWRYHEEMWIKHLALLVLVTGG